MNQYYLAQHYNLQIGDRLIRTKGILSTHHGIYVGIHNGIPMVAENQVDYGVRYITLNTFLLNNPDNLKEIRHFQRGEYARSQVINQINGLLGRPYHLINFNCEHFADLIQFGEANSKQVDNAMAGVGAFAVIALLGILFGGE